jgi:prepilin-type N-terminal cleavage/methylation domain-containing protein
MRYHRSAGFSLIELLIYISIIAVFSSMLASMFIVLGRSRGQLEARAEVNQALRFVSEKINQDIRAATSVITPASAGTSSSTLVLVVEGSTITYRVTLGVLERQVDALSPEPMTADTVSVSSVRFTRTENTNTVLNKTRTGVQVDLTIAYQTAGLDWAYDASKKTTTLIRDE